MIKSTCFLTTCDSDYGHIEFFNDIHVLFFYYFLCTLLFTASWFVSKVRKKSKQYVCNSDVCSIFFFLYYFVVWIVTCIQLTRSAGTMTWKSIPSTTTTSCSTRRVAITMNHLQEITRSRVHVCH